MLSTSSPSRQASWLVFLSGMTYVVILIPHLWGPPAHFVVVVVFWLAWLVVVVVVENLLAYFSILLHHHFGYFCVPDILHFDYCFLRDITITIFGRSHQFLTLFTIK